MVLNQQFVDTYLPLHSEDPNTYTTVRGDSIRVGRYFKAKELYNPKTGLEEHPISITVVNCLDAIRSYFNIPIRVENIARPIGRTYRNYPSSGAKVSAHHLGQAIDFNFLAEEAIAEELYLLIRDDFDNQGPLFVMLWDLGCRGFGSYDTFVHIDTVKAELYPDFAKKRNSRYQGQKYGRWNNMKVLKYEEPSHYDLLPNRRTNIPILPTIPANDIPLENNPAPIPSPSKNVPTSNDIPPKDLVEIAQSKINRATGSMIGWIEELLSNNEDKYEDSNEKNIGYLLVMASLLLLAILIFIYILRKIFV